MIALVTSLGVGDLDSDLPLLTAELPEAEVVAWDDPAVDWSRFSTVVIRSTWDYVDRREDFLTWARRVSSSTSLWNSADLVEWNTDKRYLVELSGRGIPVVDTTIVVPGDSPPGLDGDVVVKPTVGAGSRGTARFRNDHARARRHLESLLLDGRPAMVQPYVAAIDEQGETGLVYLAGRFSHAFRKAPILDGDVEWEGGLYAREEVAARIPSQGERKLGDRVIASLPPTAYARVDVVPGRDGPLLLELELTEPSLFLHVDPAAPARAAAAFRRLDAT